MNVIDSKGSERYGGDEALRHLPRLAPAVSFGHRRLHRLRRRADERVCVLGGVMDLVTSTEVFHFVSQCIERERKAVIANHNIHSLCLMRKTPKLRDFFATADLIEVDSAPLIAWVRLIGGRGRRFHRCTYLDWRDEFWSAAAAKGWRVYFLGGAAGVGERAAQKLLAVWPDLNFSFRQGYFDAEPTSAENLAIVDTINAFAPHVLLVGMGMPRQELWIADNYERLCDAVIFPVGGALDYEAGLQNACPRWIGRLGFEWLFRLAADPRRMFRRYCIEPWSLAGPALADLRNTLKGR